MEWPLSALPTISSCGFFRHDPSSHRVVYNCPTHSLHLYTYSATVQIGNERFCISSGDATITPAGTDSHYTFPQAGRHWCIHFRLSTTHAGPMVTLPLYLPHVAAEQRISLQRIISLSRQPTATSNNSHRQSLLLQELLLAVAEANHPARVATPHTKRLETVLTELTEFIESTLALPLRIPELARQVGMSQNYLARRFHEHFGMTLSHYILQRRIEVAKHYLLSTSLTIGEIAVRVGIPDPQYFNKQFRKLVHCNPSAFRSGAPT
jgi:AraC-like DNA-binding protein